MIERTARMRTRTSRGVTLLEVLVVMTIFIGVFVNTLPMAERWYETLHISSTKGLLKTALTKAKTQAQLNTFGRNLSEPSAAVCVKEREIAVRLASATFAAGCNEVENPVVWSDTLPHGITVQAIESDKETSFTCLCYRPSGFGTLAGTCNTCQRGAQFMLYIGDRTEAVTAL